VAVTARPTEPALSVALVSQVLEGAGAAVRHTENTSVSCELPVQQFIGFGYGRRLTLPCRVEINADSKEHARLIIECDVAGLRKNKRTLFYLWSIFFVAVSVPHLTTSGWDIRTALLLFSPWPAVEGNFLYDRWRLRWKIQRILGQHLSLESPC
jgi:hypothetical protein